MEPDLGASAPADKPLQPPAITLQEDPRRNQITKKYDLPATPCQRFMADTGTMKKAVKRKMAGVHNLMNPATIPRQIQSLAGKLLLTLTTAKQGPKNQPSLRARSHDSTKKTPRAS